LRRSLSGEHRAVVGDVAREETAVRLAATAREAFGRIDVLVNNVGDLFIGEITETSVDDWDRLMATNLRSMFLCCKHVIPAMLEQGGGSIVNLASISAFIGQETEESGPSFFAYSVTKAGPRQLATNLATRYAKAGIRVNAVAPGPRGRNRCVTSCPISRRTPRTQSGRTPAPRERRWDASESRRR
jgi:meso-butanediol dehydrogenase/(S,S)-butanediol dehydrogenase/diacetyl reductase